jgi:hypothetical protein
MTKWTGNLATDLSFRGGLLDGFASAAACSIAADNF